MRSSRTAGLSILLSVVLAACREDATAPTAPETLSAAVAAVQAPRFVQVAAGSYHTCGVATDGRAWCWGYNEDGEVGDGTRTGRPVPTQVQTSLRFSQISAGAFSTCGITTDDRAARWGLGRDGQLGTGTTARHLTPVAVAGNRRFRDVRVGNRHACGVTSANVAFCWGNNGNGELGDGTNTRRLKPARVAGGIAFIRVVPGTDHSCGLTRGQSCVLLGVELLRPGRNSRPTPARSCSRSRWTRASVSSVR